MKKTITFLVFIFLTFLGFSQEPDYQVRKPSGKPILIVSSITLVGVYSATIISDAIGGGKIDFPEVFIPAIGPFIALSRYDSYVSDTWPNQGFEKTLFGLSGIVQTASIVGLATGIHRIRINKKSIKGYSSYISFDPNFYGGVSIKYRF